MELTERQSELKKLMESKMFTFKWAYDSFYEVFHHECSRIMALRGVSKEFSPTKEQVEMIEQLHFYATGNEKFNGVLTKGIALIGPIGTGKTLFLRAFANIINRAINNENNLSSISQSYSYGQIKYMSAKDVSLLDKINISRYGDMIEVDAISHYSSLNLLIDDIGKEPLEIMNYGNVRKPVTDLIAHKYDYGSKLFFTSNMKDEEISAYYGASIGDRLKEMVNYFILKGNSFRK